MNRNSIDVIGNSNTVSYTSATTGKTVTVTLPEPPKLRVVHKGLFSDTETRVALSDLMARDQII